MSKPKDISPWLSFPNAAQRELVFAYEMILTEMRTHARAKSNRTIREWVKRLDEARDEYVRTLPTSSDRHE
jgi:N-dimethylarginine dimethylaminohydrolase